MNGLDAALLQFITELSMIGAIVFCFNKVARLYSHVADLAERVDDLESASKGEDA